MIIGPEIGTRAFNEHVPGVGRNVVRRRDALI
jgi:hypothetical protein